VLCGSRGVVGARGLGEPPPVPDAPELTVEVFEPGDDGVPVMWSTHPTNYDREQNAKRHYLRTPLDERSPWALFDAAAEVRERVTWRFYRVVVRVRKDVVLVEPAAVQAFIDEEHAETTYDERYHGLYDDRYVEPGDIRDLVALAGQEPWPPDRLAQAWQRLYSDELKAWADEHQQRRRELNLLVGIQKGELQ